MKIEHPEPAPRQQATADQRGSEDGDDIGVQSIGERDHVRMVDVRYLDEKILAGQRGRRRIEEKLRFAPARIAAPIAQPARRLAPQVFGSQQAQYLRCAEL